VSTIVLVVLNRGGWCEKRWGRDCRKFAAIRDVGLQLGCRQIRVYGKPQSRWRPNCRTSAVIGVAA